MQLEGFTKTRARTVVSGNVYFLASLNPALFRPLVASRPNAALST